MNLFKLQKRSLFLITLVVLWFFYGCHTKLDWDPLEFDPKPVVNGVIMARQPVEIKVSMASEFSTEPTAEVDDAQVNLFEDGIFMETLEYDTEGIYRSQLIAQENHEYRLEVSVPEYETAICSTFIPRHREIISFEHFNSAWVDEEGIAQPGLKITFENTPDTLTYYHAIIKLNKYDDISHGHVTEIIDPIILNEGLPIAVFSNQLIEENSYTLHLNYTTGSVGYSDDEGWVASLYPIQVELRTVSADYYHFIKQQHLYKLSNSEPFYSIGVTGTFNMYSNVENGYGILAGYSSVLSDIFDPNEDEN